MVVRSGIKINSWLILLPFYCCLVRLLSHSFWIFSNPRLQTEPFYLEFSGSYILFNLRFSRSMLLSSVQQQLIYYIISFLLCQQLFLLFSTFFKSLNRLEKSGERGIWTLAPVARPTPLAGAPLRPLEYFSVLSCNFSIWSASSKEAFLSDAFAIIQELINLVKLFFTEFFRYIYLSLPGSFDAQDPRSQPSLTPYIVPGR